MSSTLNYQAIYICFSIVDEIVEDACNSSVEMTVFKAVSEYIHQPETPLDCFTKNYIIPVIIDIISLNPLAKPSYYSANRDKALEYQRVYRDTHRDSIKQKLVLKKEEINIPKIVKPSIKTRDEINAIRRETLIQKEISDGIKLGLKDSAGNFIKLTRYSKLTREQKDKLNVERNIRIANKKQKIPSTDEIIPTDEITPTELPTANPEKVLSPDENRKLSKYLSNQRYLAKKRLLKSASMDTVS